MNTFELMPNTEPSSPVHVAVGVISNTADEVLIARRHPESHQGGLWEFPGGKVEPGETLLQALHREFQEELGIQVMNAFPLIQCQHDYGDKFVLLDVWEISRFEGLAQGLEGQQIAWHPIKQLDALKFPAANDVIVGVLGLPRELAITPELDSIGSLKAYLDRLCRQGIRAVQIRQKHLPLAEYQLWFQSAQDFCKNQDILLMANCPAELAREMSAGGLHLNSTELMACRVRPADPGTLLSAACHNLGELQQAQVMGVDFALLSPVCRTDKYGHDELLGWERFAELSRQVSLPVFGLGGLRRDQLQQARQSGAFGIAGIGMFNDRA